MIMIVVLHFTSKKHNKTKKLEREIPYDMVVWLSSFYNDPIAMIEKSFNFTKSDKFYVSTNLSHLDIELYYQENQLLILLSLRLLGWIILVPLNFKKISRMFEMVGRLEGDPR